MEVKILVTALKRRTIARIIEKLRNLLLQLVSGLTFSQQCVSKLDLIFHKLLSLFRIRIFQPELSQSSIPKSISFPSKLIEIQPNKLKNHAIVIIPSVRVRNFDAEIIINDRFISASRRILQGFLESGRHERRGGEA